MLFLVSMPEGTIPFSLTQKVNASFAGGNGTLSDPYQISNVTQLQAINDNLSAHYELINDIDMSDAWKLNDNTAMMTGMAGMSSQGEMATAWMF